MESIEKNAANEGRAPHETKGAETTLVIERELRAPRERVYEVWTKAEHMLKFLGPKGFVAITCEMDVRVGGAYRMSMRSPDGEVSSMLGTYTEVVYPERLAFTFAWDEEPRVETKVTITLQEKGKHTLFRFVQEGLASVSSRDSHYGGWSECFDKLAAFVAGGAA